MRLPKADRRRLIGSLGLLSLAGACNPSRVVSANRPHDTLTIPLAVALADIEVPPATDQIITLGYARAGLGAARYVRSSGNAAPLLESRDGASFQLAEPTPTIDVFGADVRSVDNSAALQRAIDHAAALGGGLVLVPTGRYRFSRTLKMAPNVHLAGSDPFASELSYEGGSLAIDCVGTADARKPCRLSGFRLLAVDRGNAATGVRLGWNQRSGAILANVHLDGFGRFGVDFASPNWLVTLRDVEISRCGANASDGCGIVRSPAAGAQADIRLEGLLIEECGNARSAAGAIHFAATADEPCAGLWLANSTIEGNFGQAEMSFVHVDHLSLRGLYVETGDAAGNARDALRVQDCNVAIEGCRFGAASGKKGRALIALGGGHLHSSANMWDADYADPVIMLDPGIVQVGSSDSELTQVTRGRAASR